MKLLISFGYIIVSYGTERIIIFPHRLKQIANILQENSQSSDREWHLENPKYETGALTTPPWSSVGALIGI